jgi:predicted transcriptional regulator
MGDDLRELIVSESDEVDRTSLLNAVRGLALIHENKGGREIRLTEKGTELSAKHKIVVYLAMKKALALLDETGNTASSATPVEITNATGVPGGTVRNVVRNLVDEKIINQEEKRGGYYVPNYAITTLGKYLSGTKGK